MKLEVHENSFVLIFSLFNTISTPRLYKLAKFINIEHSLKYKYQKQIPDSLKERLKSASVAASKLDEEMSSIHKLIQELEGTEFTSSQDPLENEISMFDLKKW